MIYFILFFKSMTLHKINTISTQRPPPPNVHVLDGIAEAQVGDDAFALVSPIEVRDFHSETWCHEWRFPTRYPPSL